MHTPSLQTIMYAGQVMENSAHLEDYNVPMLSPPLSYTWDMQETVFSSFKICIVSVQAKCFTYFDGHRAICMPILCQCSVSRYRLLIAGVQMSDCH